MEIPIVLKMEKGGRSKGQGDALRDGHLTPSGFHEEELEAWMRAAARSRRDKKMDFPLEPPERSSALSASWF